MPIRTFHEYMNEKGTVVKPVVDPTGDTSKVAPKSPKNGKPYATPTKPIGKAKAEKGGFAEKGPKDLEYNPVKAGTDVTKQKNLPSFPDVKDAPRHAAGKLKSETFLDQTAGMSPSEFAAYVSEATAAGTTTTHPAHYVKYVCRMMSQNSSVTESFVAEAKRCGTLPRLAFETLTQTDGLRTVVEMMGDPDIGPAFCRKICKLMAEEVSPPIAASGDEETPTPGDKIPTTSLNGPAGQKPEQDGLPDDVAGEGPPDDSEPTDDPDAKPVAAHNDIRNPDEKTDEDDEDESGAPLALPAHENMLRAMTGYARLSETVRRYRRR